MFYQSIRFAALPAVLLVTLGCAAAPTGDESSFGDDSDVFAAGKADSFAKGKRMPDRTAGKTPLLDASALETVAELPYPPGNIAVSDSGRVFFSFHPEGNKGSIKIAELVGNQVVAYPSEAYQSEISSVLAVRVDRQNGLWLLDYGNLGFKRVRLIRIDLATNHVTLDYKLPSQTAPIGSLFNDFQISPDGKTAYISDQSPVLQHQAIVVVDLDREFPIARRRLADHHSVDDGPYDIYVNDTRVKVHGLTAQFGVDGVALDQSGEWLYYSSLNMGELYRAPAFDLRFQDSGLLDPELAGSVEKIADITASDGMTTDRAGHVYLTDMEHSAIVRVDTNSGDLEVLIQDPRLRWPDGFGWGPTGDLYVTASALDRYMPHLIVTKDLIKKNGPYSIFRLRPQDACASTDDCSATPGH